MILREGLYCVPTVEAQQCRHMLQKAREFCSSKLTKLNSCLASKTSVGKKISTNDHVITKTMKILLWYENMKIWSYNNYGDNKYLNFTFIMSNIEVF